MVIVHQLTAVFTLNRPSQAPQRLQDDIPLAGLVVPSRHWRLWVNRGQAFQLLPGAGTKAGLRERAEELCCQKVRNAGPQIEFWLTAIDG